MKRYFYSIGSFKTILFVFCALALSVAANGQNATTENSLKVDAESDEADTIATADISKVIHHNKMNHYIISADFGGAQVNNMTNGYSTTGTGLTWALSGQVAHEFNSWDKANRLFLSAGLEIRNFNGTFSSTDAEGGTAYDNYHYWYAGIPVIFQLVNATRREGHSNEWGYYAQLGVSIDMKMYMLDVNSVQGNNSWNNLTDNYSMVMIHPYASAGVTCKTILGTYLLGPYYGFVPMNISTSTGVKENLMGYGVRFTALLFN